VVVAAKLTLVVAAAELYAVMMVMTQVAAVVVVTTRVAAVVVAVIEVAAVAVTSLNRKIQSLPHQTQCPACAIGRDSQCSFQVSIHHSL
jgi:hypothetical protein